MVYIHNNTSKFSLQETFTPQSFLILTLRYCARSGDNRNKAVEYNHYNTPKFSLPGTGCLPGPGILQVLVLVPEAPVKEILKRYNERIPFILCCRLSPRCRWCTTGRAATRESEITETSKNADCYDSKFCCTGTCTWYSSTRPCSVHLPEVQVRMPSLRISVHLVVLSKKKIDWLFSLLYFVLVLYEYSCCTVVLENVCRLQKNIASTRLFCSTITIHMY